MGKAVDAFSKYFLCLKYKSCLGTATTSAFPPFPGGFGLTILQCFRFSRYAAPQSGRLLGVSVTGGVRDGREPDCPAWCRARDTWGGADCSWTGALQGSEDTQTISSEPSLGEQLGSTAGGSSLHDHFVLF